MSNVIKLHAPFERLKLYDISPEVRLHKAIITQAIIDATNTSDSKIAKDLELDAKLWIFGGSEDFKEVCMAADIEESLVIKITKELINLHKDPSRKSKSRIKESKKSDEKKTKEIYLYYNTGLGNI